MPTHAIDASSAADIDEVTGATITCPHVSSVVQNDPIALDCERLVAVMPPASDNTASGMRLTQEDSMYAAEEFRQGQEEHEKDKCDLGMRPVCEETSKSTTMSYQKECGIPDGSDSLTEQSRALTPENTQLRTPSPTIESSTPKHVEPVALPSCDPEIERRTETKPWDFTRKQIPSSIPSSLFHPFTKFTGTQQSDRSKYHVAVTILTVDMNQCTLSGYLEICELTPEHPKLTTFFTGEIIGGPDQKYSFRTKDPSWGASNKTDLTHWARFREWRHLSPHAKTDIEFVHPVDGSEWWQQDHVFMRWKEHFLVPDYKLTSITGASFEGFYYICLHQKEGYIQGVYFHSKSEK
jgi:hypothetical protein